MVCDSDPQWKKVNGEEGMIQTTELMRSDCGGASCICAASGLLED
jgi:hypothetical protein